MIPKSLFPFCILSFTLRSPCPIKEIRIIIYTESSRYGCFWTNHPWSLQALLRVRWTCHYHVLTSTCLFIFHSSKHQKVARLIIVLWIISRPGSLGKLGSWMGGKPNSNEVGFSITYISSCSNVDLDITLTWRTQYFGIFTPLPLPPSSNIIMTRPLPLFSLVDHLFYVIAAQTPFWSHQVFFDLFWN